MANGYYDPRDEDGRVDPRDVLTDEELEKFAEELRERGERPKSTYYVPRNI